VETDVTPIAYLTGMTAYLSDLLHAARTLSRARAFTAVCVVSLGLGMGVVMAILLLLRLVFSTPPYVDRAHLAELVVRPSGQLLAQAGNAIVDTWSYPDYLDVRDAASTMTITGWSRGEGLFRPAGQSATIAVSTMYVSSNYFSTIGVTLPLGPGFTTVDDASRAEPEAVIGHRIWQTRFNSDPAIAGRTVTIDQTSYVVVGVAPEKFRGHKGGLNDSNYQLWLPLSRHPRLIASEALRLARDTAWVQILARLPEGTTVRQADAIVQSAVAALATRHPSTTRDKTGGAEAYFPPGARLRAQVSFARLMVLGLSGIVLLVVGLNISGMMLVRSAMRRRELAVRLAMGASRWRLVRYHLSEALVIAIVGGCLAAAVLFGGPIVVAWAINSWGPALDVFAPDPWLVLQSVALCLVTSLVLGTLPALRFSRPAIMSALKSDSAGSGQRVGRLQRFTAAAQAGLAVPFLVICGVYLDQARVTTFADVGFTPKGLYAARLALPAITRTEEEQRLFIRTVVENLAEAPGVASVSVGDGVPLDFIYRNARVAREGDGAFVTAHTTRVGPNYLDTIGTRLLAGRSIDANDREGSERVVLLSGPLARQLFPAGDPIGGRVTFALGGGERKVYTVVGVTADLVSTQMGNPRPQLFLPLAQQPAATVLVIARGASSAASAEASVPRDPSIRGAFHNAIAGGLRLLPGAVDPEIVFRELITGESLIENSRSDILTMSAAGGVAACVALVLATLGVYGVIAFMVATRTREIGIRVALGASRGRVLRDVLANALTLVVPGIGVGLLLAVVWVRLVDPSWYPLGGVEPLVYTIAAATAFLVAVLAGIPSARRAAAVQPMVAMRTE
jgi:putative ABC transport system permease protein